jgi:hypothetical protein
MALADGGATHRMARHAHAVFLASGMHDQKVARKKAVVSVLWNVSQSAGGLEEAERG